MTVKYNPNDMWLRRWTSADVLVELEEGVKPEDIAAFSLVVYQAGNQVLDKPLFTEHDDKTLLVKITATETQRLKVNERPQTQVRYKTKDNEQYATDIFEFVVKDVLKDGTL